MNSQKLVVEVLPSKGKQFTWINYKLTRFVVIFVTGWPRLPNTVPKYKTKTLRF